MLITPHFLLGAALAKRTDSLLWGLPLAYASHFVLDFIPNWDVGLTGVRNISIIAIDGIIALILIRLLSSPLKCTQREKMLLWTGGVVGLLPDIMSQGSKFIGMHGYTPLESLHQSIQKNAQIYWSLPAQILLSCLFVLWIRHKTSNC